MVLGVVSIVNCNGFDSELYDSTGCNGVMATPCRSLVTTSQAFLRACEASFRSTLH